MRRKKLLCYLMAIALLCGCGQGKTEESPETEFTEEQTTSKEVEESSETELTEESPEIELTEEQIAWNEFANELRQGSDNVVVEFWANWINERYPSDREVICVDTESFAMTDFNHDGILDVFIVQPLGHRDDMSSYVYMSGPDGYQKNWFEGELSGYTDSYVYSYQFSYVGAGETAYNWEEWRPIEYFLNSGDESVATLPVIHRDEYRELGFGPGGERTTLLEEYKNVYYIGDTEVSKQEYDKKWQEICSQNYTSLNLQTISIENLRQTLKGL